MGWRRADRSTAYYGRFMSEVITQRELRPLRRQWLVDARLVSELFRRAPHIDREQFKSDLDDAVDQEVDTRIF